MAKKEKKKKCPPVAAWLVTFSDLVTLLLTFFVLLLSMSSMDQSFLTRVTVYTEDVGELETKGAGRLSVSQTLVMEMIERPWEAMQKPNRIKDMLFPDEILPPDIDRKLLEENLDIVGKSEGLALVFTDKLLFPKGESELDETARFLLDQIVPLLYAMSDQVNIAGYGSPGEGTLEEDYDYATNRALAVLAYFVESGLDPDRFTLSSYGPNNPIANNDTPEGESTNRRVEVYIKSNRPMAGYGG